MKAIVTGAGRGIGEAIARRLAQDGAELVLAGRSVAPLEETAEIVRAAGGVAHVVPTDVTRGDEVARLFARAEEMMGSLELLVNNAGGSRAPGPLYGLSFDEWWSDIELNFKSNVLCCHAALPTLMKQGHGRIINIGSLAGVQPIVAIPAYSSAKAALTVFTETLARTMQEFGVFVFILAPGLVRTPIVDELLASDKHRKWLPFLAEQPDEIYVSPDLCANHVAAIASGEVDMLVGRFLHASDDLAVLRDQAEEIIANDRLVLRLK